MKFVKYITILIITMQLHFAYANEIDDYILSVDDEINILVFNEPELSIENARVASNGSISLPLIGNVNAKGLSLKELEESIKKELLKGYLKNPDITITIEEYRPFYINGHVKNPGSYPYRKDLTFQKAVTLAGGFTARASKNTVDLLREGNENIKQTVKLSETVKPGDVITVNESFF